jgi:anti-sigma-K factor RskA
MNTNEYISSGILEAYVLGSVSLQEKQEVECMSKIYPEIKTELDALQSATDAYAKTFERKPAEHLKAKIFAQMTFDEPQNEVFAKQTTTEKTVEIETSNNTKVMPMWPKFAAAASVIFGVMFGYTMFKNSTLNQELASLNTKNQSNVKANESYTNMLGLYKNSDNIKIKLNGVEKSPESGVTVFWNKQTSEVKLIVDNLPKAPAGKQYQLWTLVDGVPIDMGMLSNDFTGNVLTMKSTNKNVQAFAITLEKNGGSPTPTMEDMYVLGNV